MLEFATKLWKSLLFDDAQTPCLILPQTLEETVCPHFDQACSIHLLPKGAISALKTIEETITANQPDRLLLIPPLLGYSDLPKTLQAKHDPLTNFHDLALQTALEHVPDGALVGMLLPTSFLLTSGPFDLRTSLTTDHRLRLILEFDFPAEQLGLPNYEQARRLALIVVQCGQAGDELVRFFRCPFVEPLVNADSTSTANIERQAIIADDLNRVMTIPGGATDFGIVKREQPSADASWLPGYRQRDIQNVLSELEQYGPPLKPLGAYFTLLRGFQISEQVNYLISSSHSDKGIPVIAESDIQADNQLNYRETRNRALSSETEEYHLQANDICLRESVREGLRLNAVKITSEQLPLAAHESVIILRPKPDVVIDSDVVAAYLCSTRVVEFLRAQGIANRIYRNSLADILIPVNDDELKPVLDGIRSAADALKVWQSDADQAIDKLFADKPAKDARVDFLAAGHKLRQRERAARQIDDLSYRLRISLPHPIAYRWRSVETSTADYEGYKNLLETAEVVICYLANLALIAARQEQVKLGSVDMMAKKFVDSGHGTTFGDWISILREFNDSKAIKNLGIFPLFELASLFDAEPSPDEEGTDTEPSPDERDADAEPSPNEEDIVQILQRLSNARNDEAHIRGPKGPQIAKEYEIVRNDLFAFIQSVEFLAEYPLHYVTDARLDSLTGMTTYTYQELMGDHPLVASQEAETQTPNIEKGSLYLVDRDQQLYLLRPFLTRHQLPDGRWGTFFLDKFDIKGQNCELKCLEFPETVEDPSQFAAFRAVGLLL